MAFTGASRRAERRKAKRVRVEFGVDQIDHVGFTKDVSKSGLFLVTRKLLPIGTRVHLRVSWDATFFFVEGMVVRHKRVPLGLDQQEKQGMGIRFVPVSELMHNAPISLRRGQDVVLEIESAADLVELIANELAGGVIFVPIGSPPPEVGDPVKVIVAPVFKSQSTFESMGTVVQILERGWRGQRDGAVVQVADASRLVAALRAV